MRTLTVGWLVVAGLSAWRLRPPRSRPGSSSDAEQPIHVKKGPHRMLFGSLLSRRGERRRDAELTRELPDVVDLLYLGASAGLTVALLVDLIAERRVGTVAEGFCWARGRSRLGEPLADALEALPSVHGEALRQVVRPLVGSQRCGTELLPALESLAAELRNQRRRQAEARARRLPVKLLFPLVICILPAFALLTVVPLIASSLQSIQV